MPEGYLQECVMANSLDGPNPTNTGQALAARIADQIVERYFTD